MSVFHPKTNKHTTRRGTENTRPRVARRAPEWVAQPKSYARADAKPAIIRQQSNHTLVLIGGEKGAGTTLARRQIVRVSENQIKSAVDYLTRTAHVKGYKVVKVELREKVQ